MILTGIPASRKLSFRALRNGSTLGTHELTFTGDAASLTVDIAVDYAVKLGFITVFRYRLRGREIWSDGRLMSVTVDTNDNGKPAFMRLARETDGMMVEGSGAKRYRAPDHVHVATHWKKAPLEGPVINPQNGELLQCTVVSCGPARVADSAGRLHDAERFALKGSMPLDLWYDSNDLWVALQAKVRDGSTVSYLRIA
jgi:hypothetical protein